MNKSHEIKLSTWYLLKVIWGQDLQSPMLGQKSIHSCSGWNIQVFYFNQQVCPTPGKISAIKCRFWTTGQKIYILYVHSMTIKSSVSSLHSLGAVIFSLMKNQWEWLRANKKFLTPKETWEVYCNTGIPQFTRSFQKDKGGTNKNRF